jgi:hypothetical protein
MDILLIEAKQQRRVAVARELMQSGHRLTISSSVEEADEILGFVEPGERHPDVVVIAEALLGRPADELRETLDRKSSSTAWLPLRDNVDAAFLEHWLHKAAAFHTPANRQPTMLVVDADERQRAVATKRYRRRGRVHAVANATDARNYLLAEAASGPLVLACPVELKEDSGLSSTAQPARCAAA